MFHRLNRGDYLILFGDGGDGSQSRCLGQNLELGVVLGHHGHLYFCGLESQLTGDGQTMMAV